MGILKRAPGFLRSIRFRPDLILTCLALTLGVACGSADETVITPMQPNPLPSTATSTPSEPTSTPAIQVQTPPPTASRIPTFTPRPTRATSFATASVYAVSHLPGARLMVTLEVPGGVSPQEEYWALIGLAELACGLQPQYPDRLYCIGPEPFQNDSSVRVVIRVFPVGELVDVFEAEFLIPPRPGFGVTPTGTTPP